MTRTDFRLLGSKSRRLDANKQSASVQAYNVYAPFAWMAHSGSFRRRWALIFRQNKIDCRHNGTFFLFLKTRYRFDNCIFSGLNRPYGNFWGGNNDGADEDASSGIDDARKCGNSPSRFSLPISNRLYLYLHFICEWQRRLLLLLLRLLLAAFTRFLTCTHLSSQWTEKREENASKLRATTNKQYMGARTLRWGISSIKK